MERCIDCKNLIDVKRKDGSFLCLKEGNIQGWQRVTTVFCPNYQKKEEKEG